MRRLLPLAVASLAFVAVAACGKKDAAPVDTTPAVAPPPPPSVSTIELGRQIGMNKRVTDTTSSFGRRDTMYVAVVTENAVAGNTLTARWSFVATGQLVDSTSQAVAPAEAGMTSSVTEFHISKPTPWPTGKYKVEVTFNGAAAGMKEFEVKR